MPKLSEERIRELGGAYANFITLPLSEEGCRILKNPEDNDPSHDYNGYAHFQVSNEFILELKNKIDSALAEAGLM